MSIDLESIFIYDQMGTDKTQYHHLMINEFMLSESFLICRLQYASFKILSPFYGFVLHTGIKKQLYEGASNTF